MYDAMYMGKKAGVDFPSQNNEIVDILISRDGMTPEEAWSYFDTCKAEFDAGSFRTAACATRHYFGLEPDYAEELLD